VRAEIDLPEGTDPHAEAVYRKSAENMRALCDQGHLVQDDEPGMYVCRITMGDHVQVGLMACCSVDEYERGVIKKHELTRQDKEDDRTRHIMALGAQPGPVLATFRDSPRISILLDDAAGGPPLLSAKSETGVLHEIFRVSDTAPLIQAFAELEAAYVADGHHRSASAGRARDLCRNKNPNHTGTEEYNFFLVVLFPASQMKILAYNRAVADLNGLSADQVLQRAAQSFEVSEAVSPIPVRPRESCIYLAGRWHHLSTNPDVVDQIDPVRSLDCSLLQEHFIDSILGVADLRTDKRIKFVGGIRGTEILEQMVDRGDAAIAFSMYPTSIEQLLSVADAGKIMPPKSTWFEPKLRSGMVVHLIS
jgi:uncharacterized protein (DUF1015 family)